MQITQRHSNVETTINGNFYMSNDEDGLKSLVRRELTRLSGKRELTSEEWAVLDKLNYEYDMVHLENEDYRDIERENTK